MKTQQDSTEKNATKEPPEVRNQEVTNKETIDFKITERVFSDGNKSLQDLLTLYFENEIEKIIKNTYDEKEVRAISKEEVA